MPRDSIGTHSLPSGTLVNTGDTVLVSQHNPAMQDISQALTGSLDRDGKGGMRADLPMGNNKITGLADGVDATDAATVGQLSAGGGVPVGCLLDYWGTAPPEGWLFAAGQELSRAAYADLFEAIGTAGGPGNGSTTFNLPDYRGRTSAGKDDMGGTSAARLNTLSSTTLGAVGGLQTHTLTAAQMPSHSHSGATSGTIAATNGTSAPINFGGGDAITQIELASHTHAFTTNAAGSGEAHSNVQPTIICNKIIKVTA